MNILTDTTPFYKRLCYNLMSITLIILFFHFGKDILIPFLFAVLLSSLLLPVSRFLERRKFHRTIAIALSLAFSFVIIGLVLWFLAHQVSHFLNDMSNIERRLDNLFDVMQRWVRENFDITIRKQNQYINETTAQMKESGAGILQLTFGTLMDLISYLVLLPVYSFLLLYYRKRIKIFFVETFASSDDKHVNNILIESQAVSQRYIAGLIIELTLVFTLNAAGFVIIGIKYALFLALISALLNLIPYIGMLIANLFCMLITLSSGDAAEVSDVLWVGVVLAVVQFIDNNFLMPLVVGSKVRINALATFIGVIVGGALCGVPGMFLSIPGLALLKVIFDRVDGLQPYGKLLGDEVKVVTLKELIG